MIQRETATLRRWTALAALLLLIVMSQAATAQPRLGGSHTPYRTNTAELRPDYPQQFFMHAGVGGGLAIFSSSEINRELKEQFAESWKITNMGIDLAFLLRIGYKNIAQAEYRIEKGFGHKLYHDINDWERQEVETNIDSREWLLKLNPFFPWIEDKSMGLFLLYGRGTAEYIGDIAAFDDGDKMLFGIEFLKLYRWYGFSLSVEYHNITFKEFQKQGELPITGEWDGSYWILQAGITAGYGE